MDGGHQLERRFSFLVSGATEEEEVVVVVVLWAG